MVNNVAQFPQPESVGPRIWGQEILLAHAPEKWTLKLIKMHAGARGGLQKHRLKDEGGVMISGEMRIIYDDGSGTLVERLVGPGAVFRFPPGAVHQAIAVSDVEYYEVSTAHFNDRIHCEAAYGIPVESGGLPSTELHEVELR